MSTLDPDISIELRDLISIQNLYINMAHFDAVDYEDLENRILKSFEGMYPIWKEATNGNNIGIGNQMYKLIEPLLKNKHGLYITNFSTQPTKNHRKYAAFEIWDEAYHRVIIEFEFII